MTALSSSSIAWIFAALCLFFTGTVEAQNVDLNLSPCPGTFDYRYENELVGYITVRFPRQNLNTLEVVFTYISDTQGYGELRLLKHRQQVLQDITNNIPVQYKLQFPQWDDVQPMITSIRMNNQVICSGPRVTPVTREYIIRTITLSSTLTISTPLSSNGGTFNRPSSLTYPQMGPSPNEDFEFINPEFNVIPVQQQRPPPSFIPNQRRPSNNGRPQTPAAPDAVAVQTNPKPPPPQAEEAATNPQNSQRCGVNKLSQITPLIYGGSEFEKGKYPWLAAMFVRNRTGTNLNYQCVGNLISSKHIITAAHCCDYPGTATPVTPADMIFALGLLNLREFSTERGSMNIAAQQIRVHGDYKFGGGDADIAVAILEREAPFSDYIRPICLWSAAMGDDLRDVEKQSGIIAGWGRTETETIANLPSEVDVPIVSSEDCLRSHGVFSRITSKRTFCAGAKNNRGPCSGDSGSGFMLRRGSVHYLRGIVSLSLRNETTLLCDLNNYVVFNDLAKYRDWIALQMK